MHLRCTTKDMNKCIRRRHIDKRVPNETASEKSFQIFTNKMDNQFEANKKRVACT